MAIANYQYKIKECDAVRCFRARTSCLPAPIRAANRAAAMYTLLETAKLQSLNPEAYLRHVLQRISDHPIGRIGGLLPWNIIVLDAQAHRKAA